MSVAFCGHGKTYYDETTRQKLRKIIIEQIEKGEKEFLLGGYGNFDILAAKVLQEIKIEYKDIHSVLVVPYLDRAYDMKLYDYSVFPPIENVPLRYAISKRNQWMVENSDILIAYVVYSWGGAAKTLEYAKKRKKKIINIETKKEPVA